MTKIKVNYLEKPQCACWSPNRAPWQRPPLSLPVLWFPASLSTTVSCREECMIHAGIQLEVRSLRTAHRLSHLQNTIVLYCTHPLTASVPQCCAGGGLIVTVMVGCGTFFPYTLPCTAEDSTDPSATLTYSRRVERCTTE